MSGFAIVLRRDGAPAEERDLAPLLPPLRTRGPDGSECWQAGSLGVVATLLDTGDRRLLPRVARIGARYVVAGQVRVDDRDALVRALVLADQMARASDPDIVLFGRAWAAWGEGALARLLGDYAVAVVDLERGSLTLARDPIGIRLLYYAVLSDRVVAANTLAAVLAAPGVSRALDEDAIADFIAVGLNENLAGTTFRDVKRVAPGHLVHLSRDGEPREVRHWSLPEPVVARRTDPRDFAGEFRAVVQSAVRDRLRTASATVLMSGGLDSTALAALARPFLPRGGLHAVTVDASRFAPADELARARMAAERLGVPHAIIDSERFSFLHGLDQPSLLTPEPFDEPDLLIWRALLATAASTSRVVLYGEDPDTVLDPPDLTTLLRLAPPWRVVGDLLAHVASGARRPHLGIGNAVRRGAQRVLSRDAAAGPAWLAPALRRRRSERIAGRRAPPHRTRPRVAWLLAQPLWQPLLESLDAGVHGLPIDVRLPFTDRRVIDFALTVPPIPWLQEKRLLRDAMRGLLPDPVVEARKRGLRGAHAGRLADWWSTDPAPFVPSESLARFLDVGALPRVTAATEPGLALAQVRLRLLDGWLRATGV